MNKLNSAGRLQKINECLSNNLLFESIPSTPGSVPQPVPQRPMGIVARTKQAQQQEIQREIQDIRNKSSQARINYETSIRQKQASNEQNAQKRSERRSQLVRGAIKTLAGAGLVAGAATIAPMAVAGVAPLVATGALLYHGFKGMRGGIRDVIGKPHPGANKPPETSRPATSTGKPFTYEAMDPHGNIISGKINAINAQDAVDQIKRTGHFPTNIRG